MRRRLYKLDTREAYNTADHTLRHSRPYPQAYSDHALRHTLALCGLCHHLIALTCYEIFLLSSPPISPSLPEGSSKNTRGVLYYIQNEDHLTSLLRHAPHAPYVALMEPDMFNSSTIRELKSRDRVNGILVRYTNGNDTIPEGT